MSGSPFVLSDCEKSPARSSAVGTGQQTTVLGIMLPQTIVSRKEEQVIALQNRTGNIATELVALQLSFRLIKLIVRPVIRVECRELRKKSQNSP
jgi:hypothetical protein